jgi:hypothetical protein
MRVKINHEPRTGCGFCLIRPTPVYIPGCTSVPGVVLALLVLGRLFGPDLHGQEDGRADSQRFSFPGAFGLDVRWEGLRDDALDAATVQGLLQEDGEGKESDPLREAPVRLALGRSRPAIGRWDGRGTLQEKFY